ncbi:terminase small subunit [Winogradskyella forsetii]|uniref:terminase small subunit n=1 Tax=Winogradskyella forsetii TaxID=2686077 RepID=UPI0015BC084C|nr:terminase small subunit [Winogradskyella forsetii]
MAEDLRPLNAKQKRFCEELVVDMNQTQAAIRAGYSKKTARIQASQLLTKLNVKHYVEELKAEILEKSKMSIDECIQKLTSMARYDITDFFDEKGVMKNLSDIPEGSRLAIESLDVDEIKSGELVIGETKKLKLSSRRQNIIELLKYQGAYAKDNEQKRDVFTMGKVKMVIKERVMDET